MTSSKHDYANYDQVVQNFGVAGKTGLLTWCKNCVKKSLISISYDAIANQE